MNIRENARLTLKGREDPVAMIARGVPFAKSGAAVRLFAEGSGEVVALVRSHAPGGVL